MPRRIYTIETAELYYPVYIDNNRDWKFKKVYAIYKNGRYITNFPTRQEAKQQIEKWEETYANLRIR